MKVIGDAEADVAKYGLALGIDARVRRQPGRKPEAIIGPSLKSPAAKLRESKLSTVPY